MEGVGSLPSYAYQAEFREPERMIAESGAWRLSGHLFRDLQS